MIAFTSVSNEATPEGREKEIACGMGLKESQGLLCRRVTDRIHEREQIFSERFPAITEPHCLWMTLHSCSLLLSTSIDAITSSFIETFEPGGIWSEPRTVLLCLPLEPFLIHQVSNIDGNGETDSSLPFLYCCLCIGIRLCPIIAPILL
jgi:hypothetical protein